MGVHNRITNKTQRQKSFLVFTVRFSKKSFNMSHLSTSAERAKMDLIHIDTVINLGTPHLAEKIFKSLSDDDLIHCLSVSKTWMEFAEKILLPMWKGKLLKACKEGKAEIVKLLLDNGDDTELNTEEKYDWLGRTPFAWACTNFHEAV